jgi:hypothetical protein
MAEDDNRIGEDKKAPTVPYLPFKTFLGTLDALDSHGMPNKIDRSVFPSQSGVMQGQIITTLRFFDLIDPHGTPSATLEKLAADKENRKELLKPLINKHYREVINLGLTKASPSQLDEAFDNYGVTGDTKKKAKSFFIKAAQFIGLPLSALLTRKTRNASGTRRRRTTPRVQDEENGGGGDDNSRQQRTPTGTTKTIQLRSGGELTLSLSVNLFDLEGDERNFVFSLIDQIQDYERGPKPSNEIERG